MVEIHVGPNYVALVDDEDFDLVTQYTWTVARYREKWVYAQTGLRKPSGKWTTLRMHQLIMGRSYIDHVNGGGR